MRNIILVDKEKVEYYFPKECVDVIYDYANDIEDRLEGHDQCL